MEPEPVSNDAADLAHRVPDGASLVRDPLADRLDQVRAPAVGVLAEIPEPARQATQDAGDRVPGVVDLVADHRAHRVPGATSHGRDLVPDARQPAGHDIPDG